MLEKVFTCCHKAASSELRVVDITADVPYDVPEVAGDCCRRGPTESEVINISSDVMDGDMHPPVHLLTSPDPYDVTRTPRHSAAAQRPGERVGLTPRQLLLKEQIALPVLARYPMPVHCSPDDSEEVRQAELLETYQAFVLDLHKGILITQITSADEYSDIHCQLQEDLATLKVDQGSGCIVEFPLTAVTRLYRIIRNEGKCFGAGSTTGPTPMPPLPLVNAEHIVVVEFMRRKLVLVFPSAPEAQSFLMCMELLVRAAQQAGVDGQDRAGSRGNDRVQTNWLSSQGVGSGKWQVVTRSPKDTFTATKDGGPGERGTVALGASSEI
mmetsp:Transcript_80447/g.139619  ORF Transcript_80447/g.139619 Transcript_80447/m.139619 type:complete len:326 (-) Transcript_80447:26-1003(-)